MDLIELENENGKIEKFEICLVSKTKDKHYIVYRSLDGNEYYASYYKVENGLINNHLYNDLTDEEYKMLERLYKKGVMQNV